MREVGVQGEETRLDKGKLALRLWPGVVLASILVVARFLLPAAVPAMALVGFLTGLVCSLCILIWWMFFSRVPHLERWGGLLFAAILFIGVRQIVHASVENGMMGMMLGIYSLPTVAIGLVAWAAIMGSQPAALRRLALVGLLVLALGGWALVRTEGMTGSAGSDLAWRWSPSYEEQLLAKTDAVRKADQRASLELAAEIEWPGFRGPLRDGVLRGVRMETNWANKPPTELWRRPVGPAWSSFAVHGPVFFTQEQRGEEELVVCYNLQSGEPVWSHSDAVRFWESNAGAGPRGTPQLHQDKVVSFGATGILNLLRASDGSRVWSRDVAADTAVAVPEWGFSSSPLILEQQVFIAAAGTLAAYDLATGDLQWSSKDGGNGYSSPHTFTLDGVSQVLLVSSDAITGFQPGDGTVLWNHVLTGFSIVQPVQLSETELLVCTGDRSGMTRLQVNQRGGQWEVQSQWESNKLKPYFNDLVIHKGHAYGFDGNILACIDLASGKRQWKGGRYGHGQLLLLADQDVLLVLSEKGELVLVSATPNAFTELARIPAIEGKTWNHPVLVNNLLLVRNGQEMAAFQIAIQQTARQDSEGL